MARRIRKDGSDEEANLDDGRRHRPGRHVLVTFSSAGPASAHEERKVGNYVFHVGFGDEPAYAGAKNSVQMLLHDAKTDKPVTDLGDSLKVDVTQGAGSATDDSQKLA
jgi:hypothetical protein